MSTTWHRIVDCSMDMRCRACVFCGVLSYGIGKTVAIDDVVDMVGQQQDLLAQDVLYCVYRNLCASSLACALADTPETFLSCACCYHWVSKRSALSDFQFPMQALKCFFQNMPSSHKRKLDTRVVHRLCIMLCSQTDAVTNFFRTVFDDDELALCARVAAGTVSDVTGIVAVFIYRQNISSLFLGEARLTEIVRECLSSIEKYE